VSDSASTQLLEAELALRAAETSQHTSVPSPYDKRLMVFSGRGSRELGGRIADKLGIALGTVELKTFANGEVYCRYLESIRGADVFIVQSTHAPVNRNLMELLLMIDAAKGASAHRIIAVTPWYGYSRQDKKSKPREPITAKLVAELLQAAGVDRVLTMDLHAGQIQGFFRIPVDHMTAVPLLVQHFRDNLSAEDLDRLVVVSPDAGRAKLATRMSEDLGATLAVLTKQRPSHNKAEATLLIGDVEGQVAVLIDDMIDTAGTLAEGAKLVKQNGATRVLAAATHGLFSGNAFRSLAASPIEKVVVTDTVPLAPGAPLDIIRVESVDRILADTIHNVFCDESVSEIFEGQNQLF